MLDAIRSVVEKRREDLGTKPKPEPKSESEEKSSALPKPFPADAPARMHKSYYNNNIDKIEDIYKEQGMELPNYFASEDTYADYRRSQKMYGGKIQPRGAMRSTETR